MANSPLIKAIFKPTAKPSSSLVFSPQTKLNFAFIQIKNTIKLPLKSILTVAAMALLLPSIIKKILGKGKV